MQSKIKEVRDLYSSLQRVREEFKARTKSLEASIREDLCSRLGEAFPTMVPSVYVHVHCGYNSDSWSPEIGFMAINDLELHDFYYSSIEDLKHDHPEIDWERLNAFVTAYGREIGIPFYVTKNQRKERLTIPN